jgi:hypothetical protein
MSNLEKLDLYLIVCAEKTFVDDNELKKKIIKYMPRLNELTFNIYYKLIYHQKRVFNIHARILIIIKLVLVLIIFQRQNKVNVICIHIHIDQIITVI